MKRSTALLLALAIAALLVVNSADFFFRTPYYETWDTAANALSVIRAKHFQQLYGPYSRWGFHHPGPALFYIQALGEWLFYDVLHVSPAPCNAQTLLYLFVPVGFFVAALRVFARWLPPGRARCWFPCGALVLAAAHFTATNAMPSYDVLRAPTAFLSLWSAHALLLPFLCLLAAGASVAAGRGDDLPLLALAGGFLLQTHVAQPLFVVPLSLLAYATLWWGCLHAVPAWKSPRGAAGGLWAAWRAWPRAHVIAATILALFLVPVVADLSGGTHSNLAAILRHLHTHRGEHRSLAAAWFYFLQFGAYTPCRPGWIEFAASDAPGETAYLRAHAVLYALWALVAAVAAGTLARGLRAWMHDDDGEAPCPAGRRGSRRFLAWAAAYLGAGTLLTLYWDTIQDGQMFYYNAWFTFSLYYFGLLIVAAVVCERLPVLPARSLTPVPSGRERLAAVAAALALPGIFADGLRIRDPDPASTRAFHESVKQAMAATDPHLDRASSVTFRFPANAWLTMAGVGLQLARARQAFNVPDEWQVFFGEEYAWGSLPVETIRHGRLRPWPVEYLPPSGTPPPGAAGHPDDLFHLVTPSTDRLAAGMGDYLYLRRTVPRVDPRAPGGARIDCRADGNLEEWILGGWSAPEAWGTWSDSHHAVLAFAATPLTAGDEGVELTLVGTHPFLDPARGLRSQRLSVFFDGEPLSAESRLERDAEPLSYRIPAACWNRAASAADGERATVELFLPDATSAAALHPGGVNQDARLLGVGLREVRFQAVGPPRPSPLATPG